MWAFIFSTADGNFLESIGICALFVGNVTLVRLRSEW